jgi:hypothetical protein
LAVNVHPGSRSSQLARQALGMPGAPPSPLAVGRGPGIDSLPTRPNWYERYERFLMPAISGRYARPMLSAQAALVVDRGTAPTFMKEFSSQLERFARYPAPPADATGPAGRRSADARLVLTVGKDPPRASSGGWKRAVCPVLAAGAAGAVGSCPAAGGLRARTAGQAGAAAPLAVHRVRGAG